VILAGMLKPVHEIDFFPVRMVAQAMPTRWAFEGLIVTEAEHRGDTVSVPEAASTTSDRPDEPSTMPAPKEIDMAEEVFPEDSERLGLEVGLLVLGATLVLFVAAVQFVLRVRDVH